MNEGEAKQRIRENLEQEGYIVTPETEAESGLLIADFFAYRDGNSKQKYLVSGNNSVVPETQWVEVKGDTANFTDVLADLAKLCLITYFNGGHGLLVIPKRQYNNLKKRKRFLSAENITVIKEESIENGKKMDTFII